MGLGHRVNDFRICFAKTQDSKVADKLPAFNNIRKMLKRPGTLLDKRPALGIAGASYTRGPPPPVLRALAAAKSRQRRFVPEFAGFLKS
jgi:hypothetical protein